VIGLLCGPNSAKRLMRSLFGRLEYVPSGDTTPCRKSLRSSYMGLYLVKSLRSSYMGVYPQMPGQLETGVLPAGILAQTVG